MSDPEISVELVEGLLEVELSQVEVLIGLDSPVLDVALDSPQVLAEIDSPEVVIELGGHAGPQGPAGPSEVFLDGTPATLNFAPVAGQAGLYDLVVSTP